MGKAVKQQKSFYKIKFIFFKCLIMSSLFIGDSEKNAFGKTFNLPKGIGIWSYGVRTYDSIQTQFDGNGYEESIGNSFKQQFNGPSLLKEGDNSELGTLAEELNKFDYAGSGSGVISGLDLGTFAVDVDANVSTQIIGTGFGLTDWLTVYAGFPIVDITITTNMYMTGRNTAIDLKNRLGDLSYEELKTGLDTASGLDIPMIKSALGDMGYTGLEKWSHKGLGDIHFGFITSYWYRPASNLGFISYSKLNTTLPTGYVDDPDILTDTSIGDGYFSAEMKVGQVVSVGKYTYGGIEGAYKSNFSHTREIRKPETVTSTLAPFDNYEVMEVDPGDETEVSIYVGAKYSIFSGEYKLTDENIKADTVLSSDEDVYKILVNQSESNSFYQLLTAGISTADLYEKEKFPVPFILTVSRKSNLMGKDSIIDDYVEVELASFYKLD